MLSWAWKNLWSEPGGTVAAVVAVASAVLLALVMQAVFVGESEQIVRYLERSDAEVWVMQSGTSNMHMASSLVPESRVEDISEVSGVHDQTAILYMNAFVELGELRLFSYVVGVPADAPRGGAWRVAEGSSMPAPGGAVVPEGAALRAGLELGDEVRIADRAFTIVGLSRETRSMANTLVFVELEDLQELMSASTAVSYVLVTLEPGADPQAVAASIVDQVPNVNALTTPAFVESDYAMAMEMGVDLIRIMTLVGTLLGALMIGFTAWSSTVRRSREYAIAKALGASTPALFVVVTAQTLAMALMGFSLAAAGALLGEPLLARLLPEVALSVAAADLARMAGLVVLVSMPAAWLTARRIARLDPVEAFH